MKHLVIPRKIDGTFQKGFVSPLRNGEFKECSICGKTFYISGSRLNRKNDTCSRTCKGISLRGISMSPETQFKKGEFLNEKHPLWKGDRVGYYALHSWIKRYFGKAIKCENGHKAKSYVWANKSGKYLRDINDWYQSCQHCNLTDGISIPKKWRKN